MAAIFAGYDFAQSDKPLSSQSDNSAILEKEFAVMSLIHGYRSRGHLLSNTNPIRKRKDRKPFLQISDYDLHADDLNYQSQAGSELGLNQALVKDIITRLQTVYCGPIGFEYAYIEDRHRRNWLRNRIESRNNDQDFGLSIDQKNEYLKN